MAGQSLFFMAQKVDLSYGCNGSPKSWGVSSFKDFAGKIE
jgi:hypothetical protein